MLDAAFSPAAQRYAALPAIRRLSLDATLPYAVDIAVLLRFTRHACHAMMRVASLPLPPCLFDVCARLLMR